MACRLLVKNIANSWLCGDVIAVCDSNHIFGKYESKTQFINSGFNTEDWPREFVIVNVSDANKEDYNHLTEDNELGRRYFITPQMKDSPYYNQLLEFAEITTTSQVIDSLIQDRGE